MSIEKLIEFAKTGDKNIDELELERGFPSRIYPARQWFNWLFNLLTSKINEIIDKKLDINGVAVSSKKLETARTVSFSGAATGSFSYDGSVDSSAVLTLANSGVAASTYGTALKIPTITVNAKGLITGVSEKDLPIVNNLSTGGSANILSAEQGKVLNDTKIKYQVLAIAQDANLINTQGTYLMNVLGNTNLPINNYGVLTVSANALSGTAFRCYQTFQSDISNEIYSRSWNGIVWSAWGKILTSDSVFGVNQSRKDVTASRVLGATYTNTTLRPIYLSITISVGSYKTSVFTVNGIENSSIYADVGSGGSIKAVFNETILVGETYKVEGGTIVSWKEVS